MKIYQMDKRVQEEVADGKKYEYELPCFVVKLRALCVLQWLQLRLHGRELFKLWEYEQVEQRHTWRAVVIILMYSDLILDGLRTHKGFSLES